MGTIRTDTDSLTFDNILEENWTYPAEVTEYPVENEEAVNDHRQRGSRRLTLRAEITDSPFVLQGLREPLQDGEKPRSVVGEQFLSRLADSAKPLTYLSGRMGSRGPFWIRNIDFKITNRQHIVFNIEMVEVRFALSETVALPPEVFPKSNGGLTAEPFGVPETDTEGSLEDVKERSIARKISNFFTGGENEAVIAPNQSSGSAGGSFLNGVF